MAVNWNIFKLSNIVGNYRNFLSSRIILSTHQPVATLKQSLEEKLGLPAKPKKPLTTYFLFMKQMRPSIIQKYPDLKMVEITKMLASEWQKADPHIKEKLTKEYQTKYEEYRRAKVNYLNTISDEQKKLIEDVKIREQTLKDQRLKHKILKDLGRPKRPSTAFSLYLRSAGAKRGSLAINEWRKVMLDKWKALTEEERNIFEIEATRAMEEYIKNLKLWEAKMAESGDYDITRYGVRLNSGLNTRTHYTGRN